MTKEMDLTVNRERGSFEVGWMGSPNTLLSGRRLQGGWGNRGVVVGQSKNYEDNFRLILSTELSTGNVEM